ncbi:MAG: hypothetical protein IPJ38_15505 [Dechloromonas sp.]|uniref:Uncharacterized protein n=1 Tax=Candidatus Dechloromonas phosphorivorans TaxID=2899244 RepID=A0A935K645_9RHOO|nr:hypothetical protein [Candidatus Dechloromonas phosphorivorans]
MNDLAYFEQPVKQTVVDIPPHQQLRLSGRGTDAIEDSTLGGGMITPFDHSASWH